MPCVPVFTIGKLNLQGVLMKIVRRLLNEGENKKSIFEKALAEGLNPKKVSKYLAMYPDPEESEKYNRANNILLGICSLLVFLGVLSVMPLISELSLDLILVVLAFALLVPGCVIFCIYDKRSIGYLVLCFFLFKGVLDSFVDYEVGSAEFLVTVVLNASLLIYIVILKKKLFPHQNFFNTKKDDEGVTIFTKDLTSKASETP